MTSSINTNIAAFYAQANIALASNLASASVSRLSSGNRIVQASDDVTALAIGTSLGSQINALKTAQTNASQGTSLLQVADGALAQIQSILQQQQSIANQAQSGTLTDVDRGFLDTQFQKLSQTINSIAGGTTFNGVKLVDGSISASGSAGASNPLINTSADIITPAQIAATLGTTTIAGVTTAGGGNGALQYTGFVSNGDFTAQVDVTPPSAGGNDLAVPSGGSLNGTAAVTVNGTLTVDATSYHIAYTINGVTYAGDLVMLANTGSVDNNATVTLVATTNPSNHASFTLHIDAASGLGAGNNSAAIGTSVDAVFTPATALTGSFFGGADGAGIPVITAPSASVTTYDAALYGDLAKGSFNVYASSAVGVAGTVGVGGSALGYTIEYSINGVTYQGQIANDTTAGHGVVADNALVTLTATTDPTLHSTIALKVHDVFGFDNAVDQSTNLETALANTFKNATVLSTNTSAVIDGVTSTNGITAVTAVNNVQGNDTAVVGDLSEGVFNVSGSNAAGFTVSYTLNGSTYQGSLTSAQAAGGHKLVLDNGEGSLVFTIAASASATASDAATLKSSLETFLTSTTDNVTTGAIAYAKHGVATELATDIEGVDIANSGITTDMTDGTMLDGFDGSNVTLQTQDFTGSSTHLPSIASFSATGFDDDTVFSVLINGETYSTGSADNSTGGTLATANFDGGADGLVVFYKNGDTSSKDKLSLDLDGITANAKITTEGDVANVVEALNAAFGAGGSTGGLTFQLGATDVSTVTVNIEGATTTDLFGATTLSVGTADDAGNAADAVSAALDTITSIRAGVGAYEQQFGFAAANLQSSIQNSTAAQSSLLDTDIASESTSFATSQVKLQAGISVLAQANQQLQALLKLIA